MLQTGKIAIVMGGEERTIKFGLGATKVVCEVNNMKLSEITKKFGVDELFTEEIYGGMVHALRLKSKEPDFTREQVYDWIDELEQDVFQKVFDVWLTTCQHGETRYEKFMKALASMSDKEGEKKN